MSMECAVVCTNAGGTKSVIRNGEDGFLVNVAEWKDLSAIIDKLVSIPLLIQQYGIKARQRVIESHGLNKTVLALEEMYLRNVKYFDATK
jgi:glycosyltransferase involved in cell wall biosynthesis